jgi:hypothetical protein
MRAHVCLVGTFESFWNRVRIYGRHRFVGSQSDLRLQNLSKICGSTNILHRLLLPTPEPTTAPLTITTTMPNQQTNGPIGQCRYFYIKDGPDAEEGDLTTGWRLLPTQSHVVGGGGTKGACPTIRFLPDAQGGLYYLITGGLSVYLDRSRDLSTWESAKDQGICLQASPADTHICTEYIGSVAVYMWAFLSMLVPVCYSL